ncbi:MAG: YaaR family protein [Clostridiaceae bacterium]|nr:YaaR family protein [Clostridiaceae bacterium]
MDLKIDSSNRNQRSIIGRVNTESSKITDRKPVSFETHLQRQESSNLDEALKKMASEIIKQGERLCEKVDIAELRVYKKMISEFLDEAVRGFAKFSKESYMDRRGRHRLYSTVKRVNKNLEELTQEILKSEKDHLKILARVEDIRGLILDILL